MTPFDRCHITEGAKQCEIPAHDHVQPALFNLRFSCWIKNQISICSNPCAFSASLVQKPELHLFEPMRFLCYSLHLPFANCCHSICLYVHICIICIVCVCARAYYIYLFTGRKVRNWCPDLVEKWVWNVRKDLKKMDMLPMIRCGQAESSDLNSDRYVPVKRFLLML